MPAVPRPCLFPRPPRFPCLLLALLALTLPACNSAKLQSAQLAFRQGNVQAAEARIDRFVNKEKNGNTALLGLLEQATIRRTLGEFEASNQSLAAADALLSRIDARPEISLSRETLAAVTNLGTLPYRGTGYDRIMLHTYAALNHLTLGQHDAARVELRRAYERQREAVQQNAERLAKARDAAQDSNSPSTSRPEARYDADRATQDPRFQNNLGQAYAQLDQFRAYGDYVNPFTEWLQAVYFRGAAADGSDLESSRKSFERVAGMAPDNDYVQQDYADAEAIAAGGPIQPMTYVILATGTAPLRGEVRIDIPLWIFGGQVDYVGANFPRLIYNPVYLRGLTAHTPTAAPTSGTSDGEVSWRGSPAGYGVMSGDFSGGRYTTQLLCDMDAVVSQEFKNELPITITKTLVAAGTKAAIAYSLRRAAERQDGEIALLVRLFATIYQYAANQADLRTWASLPKQFHIARLPTPGPAADALALEDDAARYFQPAAAGRGDLPGHAAASSTITLTAPGQVPTRVTLRPGRTNLIYVRSITPAQPWQVTRFTLDPLAPSAPLSPPAPPLGASP